MKKIIAVPFVVGALGLGFVACGGDDEADAFCDKASEVESAGSSLQDLGSGDVEAAKDALSEANTKVQEAADAAPAEISDDVNTVASFIGDLSNQISDAKSPQDLLQLSQTLGDDVQELQQASDNVDQYIADNC